MAQARPHFLVKACCVLLFALTAFAMTSTTMAIVAARVPLTPADVAKREAQAVDGDRNAQREVASWYANGAEGLPQDPAKALYWYRRAAEQGDESSQRSLAEMYEFGEGTLPNHAEALYWIGQALTRYRGASLLIAGRYRAGHRAPKDFRKAAEWCRLSADAGDPDAQNMLGEIYEFGTEIQDFREAARWYLAAAQWTPASRFPGGSGAAMTSLGRLYAAGKGVPLDFERAVQWYRRGIEARSVPASFGLGLLYERGTGVPRDTTKAMELYYDAAPVIGEARDQLFRLYETVFPVPTDGAAAVEALLRAAQDGDARAQLGLGLRYKFGKGVRRDWTEAYALFNLGARMTKAGQRLPDFTGPDWVASSYMTAQAWQLVDAMQKRGQLRAALARYERETPVRE
jgi:uncharacterized protein